jgi:hypothetical protein
MMSAYTTISDARPNTLGSLFELIYNWWTKKICAVKENYFLIN